MTRLGAWTIEEFDTVTSTNEAARRAARAGAPDHSVYVATRQTAGRGRGTNRWSSPPGGLYASLLLRDLDASVAPLLPLVVGEALRRAVSEATRGVATWLKWPNDLLAAPPASGAPTGKLGGVLVESASSGQGIDWAVAGVGANLLTRPEDLPQDFDPAAVTLSAWSDDPPTPDAVLDLLLAHTNDCLYACGDRPARFVDDVNGHLAYRGAEVRLGHAEPGAPGWRGTLLGVAPTGALRLETDGKEVRVDHWHAASLRPVA